MSNIFKTTFCWQARWSNVLKIIVNQIKNMLISSIKNTLPCSNDCALPLAIGRFHLPLKLEPLEANGRGGSWWWCYMFFFSVCCVLCVVCMQEAVGVESPPLVWAGFKQNLHKQALVYDMNSAFFLFLNHSYLRRH